MSAPERRPAAILYVELRNFTRLSETLEAPQVLQLANEFFSFTGKHIGERGGRVLSLHNDSVIADVLPREGEELRSEEHTSELQSQSNLVCRLLLEKKQAEVGQR